MSRNTGIVTSRLVGAALLISGFAGPAWAITPQGGETAVAVASQGMFTPRIARVQDGRSVVVWSQSTLVNAESHVWARRFDAAGLPQGVPIQVSSHTPGYQNDPVVAADGSGNFVVAWASGVIGSDATQEGSGAGIYARRYAADGTPQGAEFRVNSTTAGDQEQPAVGMSAAGGFVIAWTGEAANGRLDVYLQRYAAGGVAQGGEIKASNLDGGDASNPSLAMQASGDFVIAWHGRLVIQPIPPEAGGLLGIVMLDQNSINVRRYRANGSAKDLGGIAASSLATGLTPRVKPVRSPDVSVNDSGEYVVAWQRGEVLNSRDIDIEAQRYSAAGLKRGGVMRLRQTGAAELMAPAVALRADGSFVLAWERRVGSTAVGSPTTYAIQAQDFDASGNAAAPALLVNSTIAGRRDSPDTATDGSGNVAVTWRGDGSAPPATLYFQRYSP